MKIVIMGSGAIGSLYGGLLSVAGEDVILLVGRQRNVDAINQSGLRIKGVMGDHSVNIPASEDPATIQDADLVIITTKAYDTDAASLDIKHLADSGAYVLVLQNGLGMEKTVAEKLGTTRILRGTTCVGAVMTKPGEVTVTGRGLTEIGSHYLENMKMVDRVAEAMNKAGFEIRTSDNIEGVVWTKTIVNCGLNPIGAITRLTNGEIYSNDELRDLIVALVEETVMVAEALGITLTTDDPVRYTLGTAKSTGGNINSMLQDILSRKRTEIEHITGAVIREASALGLKVPVSQAIYALVKTLEMKYTTDSRVTHEEIHMSITELLDMISIP
jgi:2-dehydropantoate 2-reductase